MPRTVNYVLIAVIGLFAGISIISMSALPVTQNAAGHYSTALGTTYKDDPVLGIVSALHLHGTVLTAARYYIGALAATILIIATNAGMIGISRLSWSLAEHRQLPGDLLQAAPAYRTPWFTIAFFSAIAIVLIIPGQTNFLGNLYSFGAMLSFTIAHISIVALRLKDPLRDRPYRAPWNVELARQAGPDDGGARRDRNRRRLRLGRRAPPGGPDRRYRLDDRRDGRLLPLPPPPGTRSAKAVPDPAPRAARSASLEVAYHSALVPIFGTSVDNEAMARAAKLVGPDAAVEAVYMLKVPDSCRSTRSSRRRSSSGAPVLEVARLQAKVAGCRVRCRLIRTRNPGRAIVEEAKERRSDLIYISTEHAPSEERLLGPTTRYVLAHRPCRVIVEHDPAARGRSERKRRLPRGVAASRPRKHSTRAKRGSSGRLTSYDPLGVGGRAVLDAAAVFVAAMCGSVPGATSSSIVFTGPL